MNARVKLNIGKLSDGLGEVDIYLLFTNITNLINCTQNVTEIDMTWEWDGTRELNALVGEDYIVYDDDTVINLCATSDYIIFDCDVYTDTTSALNNVLRALELGLIEIGSEGEGSTAVMLFKLNDEKDHINKDLIFVGLMGGNFKAPLGIKNIELDVINYDVNNPYNYVYIPILKRYYYVVNIQLISKDYTRLQLQEDVLMSWKDLISLQECYITRYGGATDHTLYDERYPLKDKPDITYTPVVNRTGADIIEFKYVMGTVSQETTKKPNVLLTTVATTGNLLTDDTNNVISPITGLPDIQSRRGSGNHNYLMNISDYNMVISASIKSDAPASFIRSALLLPFDLTDIFPDATRNNHVYSGGKQLRYGEGGYVWDNPDSGSNPTTWETKIGGSPYIVIADFYFNSSGGLDITNTYLDMSDNTQWEIYIPFVGWVTVNAPDLYNNRIIIYYTVDFDTGMSTAYIYNYDKSMVIWSGTCQIGMRLPLATSNADELARQKQATGLNLYMGVISSMLGVAGGVAGGTTEKVAGGLISGANTLGKNIVSAVNSFNSMIERGQINYGSSDNALYSVNKVVVRKTTHNPLITESAQNVRYIHINGYPYREYKLIGDLASSRYFEVGEIHFDAKGYNIYTVEIDEIVALLKNGVIM